MSNIASSSRRLDGRQPQELRPLHISIGELERSDGSGRFGFGSTSAIASLSGPLEVRLREELPEKATFEVTHRPLEAVAATPSRALVSTLQTILPPLLSLFQHPRSLIQLVVQTLSPAPQPSTSTTQYTPLSYEIDTTPAQKSWPPTSIPLSDTANIKSTGTVSPMTGMHFSARAAALNASMLALLDAGSVGMRGVGVGVALARVSGGLVLDPSGVEEGKAESRFVFGWGFGMGLGVGSGAKKAIEGEMEVDGDGEVEEGDVELIWAECGGEFTREEYESAMTLSQTACRRILQAIRERLSDHFSKKSSEPAKPSWLE